MGETSFIIYLDDSQKHRHRHWHISEKGKIVEFVIQYEAYNGAQWHPIRRYDTAHGHPHRDILHADGTQIKEIFSQ